MVVRVKRSKLCFVRQRLKIGFLERPVVMQMKRFNIEKIVIPQFQEYLTFVDISCREDARAVVGKFQSNQIRMRGELLKAVQHATSGRGRTHPEKLTGGNSLDMMQHQNLR